jgi:hypothetical protein
MYLYISASIMYYADKIKEDEVGFTCSTNSIDRKYVQGFGWKTWREKTIWITSEQMEGYCF